MINRHTARQIIAQSLFFFDLSKERNIFEKPKEFYQYILENFYSEENEEDNFSLKVFEGIIKKQSVIDEIIVKAAPSWPLEKISPVDRNILRMGIYEVLFSEEDTKVPPRVAINEAIEIAKTYGSKNSYKFISGVLGTIYEESGAKEKDKKLQEKKEKVKISKKGALLYYKDEDGNIKIGLIFNIFKKWTMPKGTPEEFLEGDESLAAIIKDKTNLSGAVKEKIGENIYKADEDKDKILNKDIEYFLFEVSNPDNHKIPKENKGIKDFAWFDIDKIPKDKIYKDALFIIEKGLDILKNKK